MEIITNRGYVTFN